MKEKKFEKWRQRNKEREEERWKKIEEQRKKEQEFLDAIRDTNKKNRSSTNYDLITLEGKDEKTRAMDKYEYEMKVYNGSLRAQRLYEKSSSDGYNPITGEKLPQRVVIPEKPKKPEF